MLWKQRLEPEAAAGLCVASNLWCSLFLFLVRFLSFFYSFNLPNNYLHVHTTAYHHLHLRRNFHHNQHQHPTNNKERRCRLVSQCLKRAQTTALVLETCRDASRIPGKFFFILFLDVLFYFIYFANDFLHILGTTTIVTYHHERVTKPWKGPKVSPFLNINLLELTYLFDLGFCKQTMNTRKGQKENLHTPRASHDSKWSR